MKEKLKEQLENLMKQAKELKDAQEKAKVAYWQIIGRISQLEDIIRILEEESVEDRKTG